MASNRTPTRFFGPAYLVTAGATLYTVPANKIAVVRQITYKFGVGDRADFRIDASGVFWAHTEGAATFGPVSDWLYVVLAAGEDLDGESDDGDTNITVTVDGDLYDV